MTQGSAVNLLTVRYKTIKSELLHKHIVNPVQNISRWSICTYMIDGIVKQKEITRYNMILRFRISTCRIILCACAGGMARSLK